ncbi:decarboxylating cobalt-precorrin-6B (C(15))-methyltransferase [Vibrio viridaestus]|uniref:Decarboxylating cobalt-precorrin-6B (C(15))-methyltransferase n=1 Tax=Vibrio viridaestus TaxID=2487322 RepID=A0A3N9U8M1_9VIBR|nr:decarboxylating cobalt-precorrin-6B (C(15))-methyltransferase [Vibrio viridaestus]RQW64556.1 decarboxylating cobalt-precorrin-6B (C(15))-methyltransferase [Vibrio viridaestus]
MKDSEFIRVDKVPMTKQEVRSVSIDRLELQHARKFLDIGAGTGSVGIEAAVRYPNLHVLAIERNNSAVDAIKANCQKFDCSERVRIIPHEAPCEISGKVDAAFIGGSGGNLVDIIDWAFSQLIPRGRLVLNFILQENLQEALKHLESKNVEELVCTQLLVSTMTNLGDGSYFKPNNPTFILSCKKGVEHATS